MRLLLAAVLPLATWIAFALWYEKRHRKSDFWDKWLEQEYGFK